MNPITRNLVRALGGATLALALSCKPQSIRLPTPQSLPSVVPPEHVLRAGFGRADITPPPGIGMAGYGPDGRRAMGHRQRLYARALVLEDARGERIAFVVADLGMVSSQLQRRVAQHFLPDRLGADRIIAIATHTHTGPANFLDDDMYNRYAASVESYDPRIVDYLDSGFTRALRTALDSLAPARVAWGTMAVWGDARNRSPRAFEQDPIDSLPQFNPPDSLRGAYRAVDPTWLMLRVDRCDASGAHCRPAGALSSYSLHPTVNPTVEELYDADIFGPLERRLERFIDSSNAAAGAPASPASHLLVNANHGDITANWPEESRCPLTRLVPSGRAPGPMAPLPAPEWRDPRPSRMEACRDPARRYLNAAGIRMGDRAVALFMSLADSLVANATVARAFRTLPLTGPTAEYPLCQHSQIGVSEPGGSGPDGLSRLNGWRFLSLPVPVLLPFHLWPLGEGPHAARGRKAGCQAEKPPLFPPLQWSVSSAGGAPSAIQLSVVRIGGTVLGTTPFEATMVAGEQLRRAMRAGLGALGDSVSHISVVSIANGYVSYMPTTAEYTVQEYEGGSDLYGPHTVGVVADALRELASHLNPASDDPALNRVEPITINPGRRSRIMPLANEGPAPAQVARRVLSWACTGRELTVDWLDVYPGRMFPSGAIVRIERRDPVSGWQLVTWDDDPFFELRAVSGRGRHGYRWRLRWRPVGPPSPTGQEMRVVLVQRVEMAEAIWPMPASCRPSSP